jgi:DNA-binding IclR family transcriptional regulator
MTRLSPAVMRTVAVLNFFADHPLQSFTMTDIVRGVKLSRATCHSLLAALVEADFLYRNSDKSYLLGPRLAAIGRVANENFSPMAVARPEMRKLADEFDAVCTATVREGDELVNRERATSVSHLGWVVEEGSRVHLRPPFGQVFVVWGSEIEIDSWLARTPKLLTPEEREQILSGLRFVRSLGYCLGIRKQQTHPSPRAEESRLDQGPAAYSITELNPDTVYSLGFVTAPVFDAAKRVNFSLGLTSFVHPLPGREIQRIGQRLRQVCDRITNYISQQPGSAILF